MTEHQIKYLLYPANPREYTIDEFLNQGTVNAGWTDLLRELFEKLFALGWNGRVLQIKEKFGGLRVHLDHNQDDQPTAQIWDLIKEYEKRSLTICESCGGFPANLHRHGGWLKTQCDQCFQIQQQEIKEVNKKYHGKETKS